MASIAATSKENLRVPGIVVHGVALATLVGYTVELAVVAVGTALNTSSDFHTATWETPGSTDTSATAYLLVGPSGGAVTLTAGTTYNVWVRVTGGSVADIWQTPGTVTAY